MRLIRLAEVVARAEEDAVLRALERTDGNRVQAAKLLGISRRTLYRKMTELGIGTIRYSRCERRPSHAS